MNAAEEARKAILEILEQRCAGATICPSEAARVLANRSGQLQPENDWRRMMPVVHSAIDRLVNEEIVALTWKGKSLPARAGPYRIGRVQGGKPVS